VAGVITTSPSTTLSHVNLLAKGWGIPNAYVRAAAQELQALDGQWVELTVTRADYHVRVADAQAVRNAGTALRNTHQAWPRPTLTETRLRPLAQLQLADRAHCGSKAATLGALAHAVNTTAWPGVAPVPDGFCIPFSEFAAFMAQPAAQALIQQALGQPQFATDRSVRAKALAELREALVALPVPAPQAARWVSQWQQQLGSDGVFVRSSSNSEDLPHFSGAGLYTTVPNVVEPQALVQAVKTVWASVYNAEAFEARRWMGVPHDRVVMGVLVQRAVNSQASGVLTTANPLDPLQKGVTYVAAKRGLGIRVVEGRRQAEEVLYTRRSGALQVLSRSSDAIALLLDDSGGVKEQAVEPGRAVLTDATVRQLAQVGERVQRLLGGHAQDIEWAIDPQGRVVLLQSRPFLDPSAMQRSAPSAQR
jgi:rifampicin phosphotransferase